MIVANGQDVYSTHISQHMPIMYYICAVFRLLGASSLIEYRLFFFAFLALLWVCMFVRYNTVFSKTVMILFPVGYCAAMAYYLPTTASVISDQLQAPGMAILLLEFLLFLKTKKMTISSCVWISISILISFGTAFVSIFAIFVIAIAVLTIEIIDCYKKRRNPLKSFNYLVIKYWKMILIVAAPFIILIGWYAISGNLYNFYYGAFKINTTIYPEYLSGFGTSPISTFFTVIDGYIAYFCSGFTNLRSNTLEGLKILMHVFININFTAFLFRKNKLASCFILYFTLTCATRGFAGFHSMAYYAVTIIMGLILLKYFIQKNKEQFNFSQVVAISLSFLFFVSPFLQKSSSVLLVSDVINSKPIESGLVSAIKKLTNEDDKIYIPSLNTFVYIQANRLPVLSSPASVPWMYRGLGTKEIQTVKEYMPKVAVFNKNHEIWGYKQIEYAPEVNQFISENYTNLGLDNAAELFVRNDLLEESREKLGIEP